DAQPRLPEQPARLAHAGGARQGLTEREHGEYRVDGGAVQAAGAGPQSSHGQPAITLGPQWLEVPLLAGLVKAGEELDQLGHHGFGLEHLARLAEAHSVAGDHANVLE